MPVLSLPIPLPGAAGGPMWLPLRIPFPMMRIGSILPSSINEPFKNSLIALFKLAWSNKVQLPVLITVCFMAFDIRMQLEINFFWENPRPNATRPRRTQRGASSNINHAALQAAVVTAALLERQRQRMQLQERARLQELARDLNGGRHNYPAIHIDITDDEEDNDTDTADEQGSASVGEGAQRNEKRKKKRKSGCLNDEDDEEEDTEDDDSDGDGDNDDDDGDDDSDDDNNGGASQNPECFGGSDGDHDYFSEDNSNGGDGSDDDEDSNGGGTPLVVQLEIHQRSTFIELTNKLSSVFDSLSVSSLNFVRSLKYESVPLKTSEMQSVLVSEVPFVLNTLGLEPPPSSVVDGQNYII